jgi:hypothetical protein
MRHFTSDVVTDGERRGADEEGVLTLAWDRNDRTPTNALDSVPANS